MIATEVCRLDGLAGEDAVTGVGNLTSATEMFTSLWRSATDDGSSPPPIRFVGAGGMPARFRVTDFAAASMGLAAARVAELIATATGDRPALEVDRTLAVSWFKPVIRPVGWSPPGGNPLTGEYRTADERWIRFQMNYPRHHRATLGLLGAEATREAVAAAVATWSGEELEKVVAEGGGAAALCRTRAEWEAHPQGRAVAAEPLASVTFDGDVAENDWAPLPERPLSGIRVLDCTRVLAGPMATRFLAGYGAEVLRIDPPGYNEPRGGADVTLGKRCARLDLSVDADRDVFLQLLATADVFVHGYRPGVLDRLGVGRPVRQATRPGLVEVCLSAYGWSGPWRERRGFDTVVEMSSGIATENMRWSGSSTPALLPVQALDHGTGHLLAAAAVRGLIERLHTGRGSATRCSLARTAEFVFAEGAPDEEPTFDPARAPTGHLIHSTPLGPARRVLPPFAIETAPWFWDRPGERLGSSLPVWG
jgi:hypothetical protein